MIDELTVRRMSALSKHWKQYPPVHVSVALFMSRGKAAEPEPTAAGDEAALAELLGAFPMVNR